MMYPRTRHREAQLEWASLFLFVACLFWVSAQTGDFAMSPEVYGPVVIAVPAELWSSVLLFANATHLMGLYINGRWRWSPFVRVLALLTHSTFSFVFLTSSLSAPFGDVVTLFSAGFAVWNLRYLWINLGDCVRAIRGA